MGKRNNSSRVGGASDRRIGLIIAPSLAAMGSFLLQLKYPSTLKCNRDGFFLVCPLPCTLAQGTVTSALRAFSIDGSRAVRASPV